MAKSGQPEWYAMIMSAAIAGAGAIYALLQV